MNAKPSIDSIFCSAIEIESPDGRRAFVEQACGEDADLKQQVERLLHAHFHGRSILDAPVQPVATIDEPFTETAGTVTGPYKLLEPIGEGGMGAVWMAQQTAPVKRLVALKLIKAGMDSKQVVARFEAERQALALMDHPNIARVLDAGTTGAGRPYFVMDLVKGVPITKYCDEHRLTPRQRLALYLPVCQAVQHAHQKGIIHRDLKPSNVLVALYDGQPVPKVIDFGVAKATGQRLTDKTLVTGFGSIVGTLEYMSPEQAGLNQLDIDMRSDVYSLGVLLYELLTGSPPFTHKDLEKGGMLEMLRVIREQEPSKPSTKLSTAEGLPTLAANRGMEPAKLTRLVRGELDWIVLKALEKDRNRRYETASAFATDVQHYLHDEPVQACPPSAWYRVGKFTRRHRTGLALAACVLALVLGLASSGVWFAKQRAVRLADTDRTVTAALAQADILVQEGEKQIDHPERWQATARLALAAVEKAEGLLAAGVATEELAARVRQTREAVDAAVSDSWLLVELDRIRLEEATVDVKENLFDRARAAPLYADLLRNYGVDLAVPEAAATRVRYSRLHEALLTALADWKGVSQDAEERQRVAKVYELALPPNSLRSRLNVAASQRDGTALTKLAQEPAVLDLPPATLDIVAKGLAQRREWAAAEQLLRAGLERNPGDFWLNLELGTLLENREPQRAEEAVRYLTAALALRPDSPGVHLNLGLALLAKGDVEGEIRYYQAALRISPKYAAAHTSLGLALANKGRLDEALDEHREAIRIKKDFPLAHNNLGNALRAKGQLDEAIAEYREAIRIKKDYPEAHTSLGLALANKGRLDEAIDEYREAIRTKTDFPEAYKAHYNLGSALYDKGRLGEAIAEYREGIRTKKDDPEAHYNLGNALRAKGQLDEAIAEYRETIQLKKDYPKAHSNLGLALANKGRLDEAIDEYREAIRTKKVFPEAYRAHYNLGIALYNKGRLDEAVAEYRKAISIQKVFPLAHYNLGNALRGKGRLDEAIDEYREAIRTKKDFPEAYQAHFNLGNALYDKGQLDDAIAEYREAIRIKKDHPEAHSNLG
jgi:tetratricopeptide (TPR) repeat protein/serine/threonine protein kinase